LLSKKGLKAQFISISFNTDLENGSGKKGGDKISM
jgi:hypothetical protein